MDDPQSHLVSALLEFLGNLHFQALVKAEALNHTEHSVLALRQEDDLYLLQYVDLQKVEDTVSHNFGGRKADNAKGSDCVRSFGVPYTVVALQAEGVRLQMSCIADYCGGMQQSSEVDLGTGAHKVH